MPSGCRYFEVAVPLSRSFDSMARSSVFVTRPPSSSTTAVFVSFTRPPVIDPSY